MALKVADRVRENTSTTGTGALTLAGAPDGYREFSSALSESDNTYYTLEENDQYEVGIGTFSSSTLERSVVLKSSNSNNKIELGGSGAVFITYPADKSVYRDQESQVVVDASGLLFSNATVIKDAKITELTDIHSSGTPSSSHIMTFDFTDQNLLIGDGIGGAGSKSVILGDNSGNSTSTNDVVIIGAGAATEGVSIVNSVFVGSQAGPTRSDVLNAPYYSVVMGYNAADEARHESSIIGYKAGINSYSIGSTALGYFAGSGVGDYATSIGYQAGNNNNDDYTINIGYQAGYSAGGDDSIWIGRVAGYNSTAAVKSVGLGYAAGQSSSADNSIYLGMAAGTSNTTDNMFFVANNTPASNGSLIKGDLANKRIAIGAADVTLSDTLYVGINSANDVGITVKAATSQAADLTQWQNSAGGSVASITNSGVMTLYGVHASGAGLQLDNITPNVTNNTLYNVGGTLYWDGSEFTAGIDAYTSGNAVYASGEALSLTYASGLTVTNASNIVEASGALRTDVTSNTTIANYASGEAVSLTYASGLTATNATNISAVTSTANYASGQSLSLTYASGLTATNQTNISTATAVANYASGQVNITTDGTAEASKALILDSAKTFTGVKDGVFNEFDSLVKSSGLIVGNSGIVLSSNTPSVTTNTLYNDGGTLSWNGSAVGGDGGASATATYASGQALSLTYASGLTPNIATNTAIANYASGQALSLTTASGIANYSSGVVTGGIANLNKLGINTGSPAYGVDVVGAGASGLIQTSGIIVGNSGIVLADNAPSVTTNTLYNEGGTLSWNGSAVGGDGGGDVSTAQLNYVSGIAVYSSGQAIENEGLVTYASGQAIENETDLLYVSGAAAYASGNTIVNDALVAYASGQAIENESDLLYVSGAAAYSSGVSVGLFPETLASGTVYVADGDNKLINAGFKLNTTANILHTPTTKGGSFVVAKDGVNHTVGVSCVAINNGAYSRSYGQQSIGIGNDAIASALRSVTIGNTINNGTANRVMIGAYQTALLDFAKEDGVFRISDLELHNGDDAANAAEFTVMKTWTSSTDYEGLQFGSDGTYHTITSAAGTGGGTVRDISVNSDLSVSGVAAFQQSVGVHTASPAYGLDVVGAGASGLIQSSGILIGASGIGVGTTTPVHPIDVVQHSGVIRASGMHSTISMNADADTITFDLDQATTHGVTLGGTRTLALSNVQIGDKFLIRLQQDGTGSRTVNWFNHIKWAGGSAPTLTTTPHKADIIGFLTASGTGSDYWFDGLVVGQNI